MKSTHLILLFLIFTLALVVRLDMAKYGELNEFDPYWNYKATSFLVDNGWGQYKDWNDETSWYPEGRNVSFTSQESLHLTTAFLYELFWTTTSEDGKDLYRFTILIPAIFGALTVFPLFYLITKIGRTVTEHSVWAGLIGATFFSITFSILIRNSAGWFKSEPLGLLAGLTLLALFTYLIQRDKINIMLAIVTGAVLTYSLSAWVGTAIFLIPIILYGLALPITKQSGKVIGQIMVVVGISALVTMNFIERTSDLFFPIGVVLVCIGFFNMFSHKIKRHVRIIIILTLITIVVGGVLSTDVSMRYKTSLFPFLQSDDPLVTTISEHQLPTLDSVFFLQGFYIFLAPIGLIMIYKKKQDRLWLMTLTLTLMYFGMSLIRLQIMLSLAMIIISSIGLIMILEDFLKRKSKLNGILFMILVAVTITPFAILWVDMADQPPAILTGATSSNKLSNEWLLATDFIKTLEPDAKILSWWDYGYWITVLGERTTYMDNATIWSYKIINYAKIFAMPPEIAHSELLKIDADYVLVYSTSYREDDHYKIILGGDELKSYTIFNLAGKRLDGLNENYFQNSLLGSMIPFENDGTKYIWTPKYTDSDLFSLVYASPSYMNNENGVRYGILIYKVIDQK